MTIDGTLRLFLLLAAGVWVGGLIVLGSVAGNLRRYGARPDQMRAMARGYGRVAWPAMVISAITGFWQTDRLAVDMGRAAMTVKLLLVVVVVALAGLHQLTARHSKPAVRGVLQAVILLLSLAVLGAAVAL